MAELIINLVALLVGREKENKKKAKNPGLCNMYIYMHAHKSVCGKRAGRQATVATEVNWFPPSLQSYTEMYSIEQQLIWVIVATSPTLSSCFVSLLLLIRLSFHISWLIFVLPQSFPRAETLFSLKGSLSLSFSLSSYLPLLLYLSLSLVGHCQLEIERRETPI